MERMAVYFGELGSTDHYFQGFGEQAHCFGDLGRAFTSFDFEPLLECECIFVLLEYSPSNGTLFLAITLNLFLAITLNLKWEF